jgi:hypothetical protein
MQGLRNIGLSLKRISFYIPFTLYFLLFSVNFLIAYKWLQHRSKLPDSSYKDIFTLLLSMALWAAVILLGFCLLTAGISFFIFWRSKKRGKVLFDLKILDSDNPQHKLQTVSIKLTPVLKPLLGFLKIRLNYDQVNYSGKFYLLQPGNDKLFNPSLEGVYHWDLPEIKEYRLEKAIIYFEDFFHFFSLALPVYAQSGFHTVPGVMNFKTLKTVPRKTEDTSVRIEELRRVEGELINYKNFESNDDVRRIVWKIYAKNKELVVRIPEIVDPYASHIYLYASFYSQFLPEDNEVIRVPFLNYYKTLCWSVYKQLLKKGLEVRFIPDQTIPLHSFSSEEERIRYSISVSAWQKSADLKSYIKPGDASVIMISSLSDKDQVKELIDRYGNEISFVFVPLTESLSRPFFASWIKWLFVQEEKDKASVYRTNWSLSLIRRRVEQNEHDISELLKEFERSTILNKT